MYQFTATRAEQHRAELMAAAWDARDQRAARTTRRRHPRLRMWHRLPAITLADAAPVKKMARLRSRAV